jgi:hypothetical protein
VTSQVKALPNRQPPVRLSVFGEKPLSSAFQQSLRGGAYHDERAGGSSRQNAHDLRCRPLAGPARRGNAALIEAIRNVPSDMMFMRRADSGPFPCHWHSFDFWSGPF